MAARYLAYPAYRESGLMWLGRLPAHWGLKRLVHFFNERRVKVSDADYPALSVTMQGIVPQLENAAKTDDGDNRKLVLKNDFVINSRSDRKGSSGISPYDGSVSLISIVMAPRNITPAYAHYLLRSRSFQEEFYRYGKGIVADLWSTNSSEMKNILMPDVPSEEQAQISSFLDHETAKIDTLIEKQQQLIKLLKEKRQAVISHAVTKGLNPDVPMRDSGVEWLGEVPAHWTVCRVKQVAKLESGHTPDKKNEEYWVNCDIPWVSLNDSSQLKEVDYITETAFFLNEKGLANSSARKLPERCVVFTRDASIGLAAITTRVMAVSQHVIAWVCNEEKVIPEYLLLVFYAMKEELDRYTFGATLKTIGMPDVNKLAGAFPDIETQKMVVDHVFKIKEKIGVMISKAEDAIRIIRERRTALISAAVTGKIDVRDWQPPAPQPTDQAASVA